MTNTPVTADTAAAVARTVEALASRPSALLFDFDGVLSELVDDPDDASIERRSEAAIRTLTRLVDAVAIVTGRAVSDVQTRLDTRELIVVGNHGLEWVVRGERGTHEAGPKAATKVRSALSEIRDRLMRDTLSQGVIFEDKDLSASIHYRMAPNQKQVGSVLIPLARRVAASHGLRMTEGKLVVELRPEAEVSKGTAMRQLQEQLGLASMVFLGDDLTDVDGFRALRELREDGIVQSVAVGVLGRDSHPDVALTADVGLAEVRGVADYLEQLIVALKGGANR